MKQKIEFTNYNTPLEEFDLLLSKYNNGKYDSNGRVKWFEVLIPEFEISLVWFCKKVTS